MFKNKIVYMVKKALYVSGWCFFRAIFSCLWRRRVIGLEYIPAEGPVIIASNHLSNADPPVVGSSLKREVFYIAKEELFRIPVLGTLIRLVNGFPVKREQRDIKALKVSLSILQQGKMLLLFPEGHRNPDKKILKLKAGVGLLANMSRAAVIPTLVINTDQLLLFKKIYVVFGKPLYFQKGGERSNQYYAFTQNIMNAIAELREQNVD